MNILLTLDLNAIFSKRPDAITVSYPEYHSPKPESMEDIAAYARDYTQELERTRAEFAQWASEIQNKHTRKIPR